MVKLAKFRGPFEWHHHAAQDELFLVRLISERTRADIDRL